MSAPPAPKYRKYGTPFDFTPIGIGRYHKSGVPTELAMSVPFTNKPQNELAGGIFKGSISICPGWDDGMGNKQYISELSED